MTTTVSVPPRRVCVACRETKPLDAFGLAGGGRHRTSCRECHAKAERERRGPPRRPRRAAPARPQRYSQGGRVIAWIEAHCVFTEGKFRGQRFVLLPWQRALLWRLFEIIPDRERPQPEWLRRFRQALIGVPKKAGKTELLAAIGLWFLFDDDELSPKIACAAASDDQADLIFGAAKTMCELSPTLSKVALVFEREIRAKSKAGKMFRVAAGGGKLDGANLSVVLIDELHEWITEGQLATYRVLTNGTIARDEPMILQITTAGYDQETLCYRQYDYGRQVESGELEDPSFFFHWQSAPVYDFDPETMATILDEDGRPVLLDYRSAKAFEAAQPSAGVTVTFERFLDECRRKPEAEVRRYYLNQWTDVEAAWLPAGAWDACQGDDSLVPLLPTVVTIDASTKIDSTAVTILQEQGDVDVVRSRVWERPFDPRRGLPDEDWALPIEEVKEYLRTLARSYNVRTFGYDPAFITWAAQELRLEGLPMAEIPQRGDRMIIGAQGLYERVVQRRLRHDGDPALKRHLANAVAQQQRQGGWRLVKGAARKPMDAAISLAMAVYLVVKPDEDVRTPMPHIFEPLEDSAE